MKKTKQELWQRFQKYYSEFPEIGLTIDLSRVDFPDGFEESMESRMDKAFEVMSQVEKGAIGNLDENRMVGHYWLRNPALALSEEIQQEIEQTITSIEAFVAKIHHGELRGSVGTFKNLLLIGIGGSALGPQFVSNALSDQKTDKVEIYFFDNANPDGMNRVLARIGDELNRTLCVVISKSRKPKETRNGMLEAEIAYQEKGLRFSDHAVAVTGKGSLL